MINHSNKEFCTHWIRRFHKIGSFVLRLYADILVLFHLRNTLFIYSCTSYKGKTLVHFNWGDDINKFFLENISSLQVSDIKKSFLFRLLRINGYYCIGSILGMFNPIKYEVWGSGFIQEDIKLNVKPRRVHSVRGPLTRIQLLNQGIACPEKYGDPALLVSRYYREKVNKQYAWGIIPHYVDEDNPILHQFCQKHPEIIIISMQKYDDWTDIPKMAMRCKRIISSSLHGLIIADSYGIRNTWVRFSDKIIGGNFKYQDYFMSVGRKVDAPVEIKGTEDLEQIIQLDKSSRAASIDFRDIYETCPFKRHLMDYYDLTPHLPQYANQQEKGRCFNPFFIIETEEELDGILNELMINKRNYAFYGVNNASFKLFSSFQNHWHQTSDIIIRLGKENYHLAISELLSSIKHSTDITTQCCLDTNDEMRLLAQMSFCGIPSPVIAFTNSVQNALRDAVDDVNSYRDGGESEIDNYFSLYFIKRNLIPQEHFDCFATGNNIDICIPTHDLLTHSYASLLTKGNIIAYEWISSLCDWSESVSSTNKLTSNTSSLEPRIAILNNTINLPLETLASSLERSFSIGCLNIHKRLGDYIIKKHLSEFNHKSRSICVDSILRRVLDLI